MKSVVRITVVAVAALLAVTGVTTVTTPTAGAEIVLIVDLPFDCVACWD
ncbi:hypothetical protein [Kribbella catacumbae]|nr:hypothetical protein [Kribbella catacumbae]